MNDMDETSDPGRISHTHNDGTTQDTTTEAGADRIDIETDHRSITAAHDHRPFKEDDKTGTTDPDRPHHVVVAAVVVLDATNPGHLLEDIPDRDTMTIDNNKADRCITRIIAIRIME